jgi:hypothetical protein
MNDSTEGRLTAFAMRINSTTKFLTGQARLYRRLYYSLNATQVVAASLVPILAFALAKQRQRLGAAIAGAITAIAKGLDAVFKSHENWIQILRVEKAYQARRAYSTPMRATMRRRPTPSHCWRLELKAFYQTSVRFGQRPSALRKTRVINVYVRSGSRCRSDLWQRQRFHWPG